MHFSSLLTLALAGIAQAVDVQVVSVGRSAANQTGLKFWPESIKAEVGSMVQFQFWVGNHTVTQSNFDNPCVPISNINSSIEGVYSGYMPVEASASKSMIPTYTITVKDEKPLWLFCSQATHCQGGMSMVINENTSANSSRSLQNYKTLAESATGSNLVPGESEGGDDGSSDDGSSGDGSSGDGSSGDGSSGDGSSGDGSSGDGSSGDGSSGDGSSGDDSGSGSGSGSGSDTAISTPISTPTSVGTPSPSDTVIPSGAARFPSPSVLFLAVAALFILL